MRPGFTRLSAQDWIHRYPTAILDEVQKAPGIIESIRAAHDAAENVRYILLGSSQILLLSQVKESLAGRAALAELMPLTLPEILTESWDEPLRASRLISWLGILKCRSEVVESLREWAERVTSEVRALAPDHGWKRAFRIWNAALSPEVQDASFVDRLCQDHETRSSCIGALRSTPVFQQRIHAIAEQAMRLIGQDDQKGPATWWKRRAREISRP